MTFLDSPATDWTRPEVNELRDCLVLAFPQPEAARHLADASGIEPGTIPLHHNMRSIWTELVNETARQGKLRLLVEKAAAASAAAGFRARFEDLLEPAPELAPPQPPIDDNAAALEEGRLSEAPLKISPERLLERRSRLMRIELAAAVTAAACSVAKLSLRFGDARAHGTGFLIHADRILTNHHNICHEEYGEVTSVVAEFDYEEKFAGEGLVRKGKLDTLIGNDEHDWAVIQLESAVDRPKLKLGTPYDVGVDDAVVIIQHPLGAFKQFSLEPLAIRAADENRIQYVADTQQGSSGSPVFNVRMHVIGLHHAEAEANVDVDGRTAVVWRNQGIAMTRVMQELDREGVEFDRNQ
jgi:V8-like Glu-specific endopeptidase